MTFNEMIKNTPEFKAFKAEIEKQIDRKKLDDVARAFNALNDTERKLFILENPQANTVIEALFKAFNAATTQTAPNTKQLKAESATPHETNAIYTIDGNTFDLSKGI